MSSVSAKKKESELTPSDRYNLKRERIKRTNRLVILNAALDVFSEVGYEGARVRDIIERSELSPGTFYNHFRSKEEIFNELIDSFLAELEHDVEQNLKEVTNSLDFVTKTVHNVLKTMTRRPRIMQVAARNQAILRGLREDSKVSRLFRRSEKVLEKGMDLGVLPRAPVRILNLLFFGTTFEVLAYLGERKSFDIRKVSEDLACFIEGGLRALSEKHSAESPMGADFPVDQDGPEWGVKTD